MWFEPEAGVQEWRGLDLGLDGLPVDQYEPAAPGIFNWGQVQIL